MTPKDFLKRFYPAGFPISPEQWEKDVPEIMESYAECCQESQWISIEERLPDFEIDVLVQRPNKYSGKVDILIAYLQEPNPIGQRYGRLGAPDSGITFDAYWVLPAISLLKNITHWRPLPKPPKQ